jgi:hypothetical protein
MFYRDKNGAPVSGILADLAYKNGNLDFISKMRYEVDIDNLENKPTKIDPLSRMTSSTEDFNKPKPKKTKMPWDL